MSGYKFHYFNSRGRAEICRLAFAAAKIEYEDIRLNSEEWAKEKECEYKMVYRLISLFVTDPRLAKKKSLDVFWGKVYLNIWLCFIRSGIDYVNDHKCGSILDSRPNFSKNDCVNH